MRRHFAVPEAELRRNLAGFPFVRVYRGWIPERFGEVGDRQFSFVHIDVDLYRPTLDSLRFFHPRLKAGGWIVVDDYNFRQFPGANAAVNGLLETMKPACAVAGQAGRFLIRK